MSLYKRFDAFIRQEKLFTAKSRLLLAVSGGIDSAVLCALCHQGGYDFTIAHCNFRLRGPESDRDEAFVRSLGAGYNRPVLVQHFDTEAYAARHKVSIQVAARELRYAWFHQLLQGGTTTPAVEQGAKDSLDEAQVPSTTSFDKEKAPAIGQPAPPAFDVLLTAHHLDDNVETMLMKFFKGTGVAGMRGMLPRQGHVVRPLLFARKEELAAFAQAAALTWVEDSSNEQDKYARNYLRLQVIPLLQKLYPEVVGNLAANMDRFRAIEVLYHQSVDLHLKKLLEHRAGEVHIPVLKLRQHEPLPTLLYEIARPYGFTPAQTGDILRLLDSETGRYVASASHRILRNRNWLIIAPAQSDAARHVLVDAGDRSVSFPGGQLQLQPMKIKDVPVPAAEEKTADAATTQPAKRKKGAGKPEVPSPYNPVAYIDSRDLAFPLLLRPWKAGDYFYPLGMQKKKKLARFLIDGKLSATEKEKVWVLESNKRIVWVVGMRIDNRFRLVPATRHVLQLTLSPGAGNP